MKEHFVIAFIGFVIIAAAAVGSELELDHWLALSTNGALAVTAIFAYQDRIDITILSLTVLCTSLVWHSSGDLKEMDGYLSRLLGYYAIGCTAFPQQITAPITLLLAYVFTFEAEVEEVYIAAPLLAGVILYKLYKQTFTQQFLLVLILGGLSVACYSIESWHSMWHVLAAWTVALTIEKKLPEKIAKEVKVLPPVELRL